MGLLGLVMCGGQSSRMGKDKGLLIQNGPTWAEIAAQKLKSSVTDIYFSVNEAQLESYASYIDRSQLIADSLDIHGPLAGLLSVHQQFKSKDLLIIACDMVDIQLVTIKDLITLYREQDHSVDAIVYKNEDYEPLLGIYKAVGLSKIFELLKTNTLSKHSMKHVLDILATSALPIENNRLKEFKNYNYQHDLANK